MDPWSIIFGVLMTLFLWIVMSFALGFTDLPSVQDVYGVMTEGVQR